MTKQEEIIFLEQLEEIRKFFPAFGYSGCVGWVDEDDDVVNWSEE